MSALWLVGSGLVGSAASGLLRLGQVDDAPDPSEIKPGWVALVIVLALCVVTTLLWLNMRKQIRKINFEEEKDAPPRRPAGERPAEK